MPYEVYIYYTQYSVKPIFRNTPQGQRDDHYVYKNVLNDQNMSCVLRKMCTVGGRETQANADEYLMALYPKR